jgi:hypothetical protein
LPLTIACGWAIVSTSTGRVRGHRLLGLLRLLLLDQGEIQVVHEEADIHEGHRDAELGGQAGLHLRKRGTGGYPGGDLGGLSGSKAGHGRKLWRCPAFFKHPVA